MRSQSTGHNRSGWQYNERLWLTGGLAVAIGLMLCFAPPPIVRLAAAASGTCGDPYNPCTGTCCSDGQGGQICCEATDSCCDSACCSDNCVGDGLSGEICCASGSFGCAGSCCDTICCDTDNNGQSDACGFLCDIDGDGTSDSCNLCDNDGNSNNDDCYRCDLDDDGKNDACFAYDTDGDGKKDSCCARFTVDVTFTDNFAGRSKTKAGVGETGSLTVTAATGVTLGAVTYTTSDATCIAIDASGAFTAKDHACSATLCAKEANCKSCKTVQVVEPSGAIIEQAAGTCVRHTNNTASVGFKGQPYITPADVSFDAISVREETCAATATGYWASLNGLMHPQGSYAAVGGGVPGKGSKWLVTDTIDTGTYTTTPYSAGTFNWPIPWSWKLGTTEKIGFTTMTHNQTVNASGDTTISKGGTSKSKLFGDPTTTFTCP